MMLRFSPLFSEFSQALRLISRLGALAIGGGVLLSGCGFVKFEQREAWRAQAEIACMRSGIIRESQYVRPTKPIDGPGPCGTDLPLKVSAFQNDVAAFGATQASAYASMTMPRLPNDVSALQFTLLKPEATMGCPMVAWTDNWVAEAVQPAAIAWFGQGVKEIRTGGAYACRRRNHNPNAKLSEHAYGNAIDVMSFILADGNVVTVKGGWRGSQQEQGFLRDVLHGACERFKTVLGPGSDALHYDHFHLDLAHHDQRGQRRYCKPKLNAPQRPLMGTFGREMPPVNGAYLGPIQKPDMLAARPPANSGISGERLPVEIEGEFDPKDFDTTGSTLDLPRPRHRTTDTQPLPKPSPGLFATEPATPREVTPAKARPQAAHTQPLRAIPAN